jgi:intracellular sulfur oxidation DsrE/DsrF family protein
LLDGATNAIGESFAGSIGDLASKGVEFKVCNNTLVTRKIPKDRVVMEASVVPSGVAEVALLQARSGFVYLRP